MEMIDLADFYNNGFGWICKHCERELAYPSETKERSRLMTEGEAEIKNPELSSVGLAKWTDKAQTTLICPRCGISEFVDRH